MLRVLFLILLATSLASTALAADPPLPRLNAAIEVDGKLGEWRGAAAVPMLSAAQIGQRNPQHEWKGPADAGAEFMCGWTSEGLCLAVRVADDDICLAPDATLPWHRDCLEFCIDGRTGPGFRSRPYSSGAYQLFILPPSNGEKPSFHIDKFDKKIDGLKVATMRTEHGWDAEIVIPWSAFPGLSAALDTPIGLLFGLNEYDRRDGSLVQPLMLRERAEVNGWRHPNVLTLWRLSADKPSPATRAAGPEVTIGVPRIVESGNPFIVEAQVGSGLSSVATKMRISLAAGDREIEKREVELKPLPAPWQACLSGSVDIRPTSAATEEAKASVEILDGEAQTPLARAEREVTFLPFNAKELEGFVDNSKIKLAAQTDPHRLRLWAGVGMLIENCEGAIISGNASLALQFARELRARTQVLEQKAISAGEHDLLQLLQLESDPAAQVTVHVVDPERAQVAFYAGAFPLAGVYVHQWPTEAGALRNLANAQGGPLNAPTEETTMSGMRARVSTKQFVGRQVPPSDFSAERDLFLVTAGVDNAMIFDARHLDSAAVNAAAVLPGCPAQLRAAVEEWATRRNVPIMNAEEALGRSRAVLAGDLSTTAAIKSRVPRLWKRAQIIDGPVWIAAQSGTRVYTCSAASREIAELATTLVDRRKAVSEEEADQLRQLTLTALTKHRKPSQLPAGTSLYLGDVHSHSTYSDGNISPVSMLLLATYSNSDYHVLSDHYTIEGAVLADNLVKKHSYAFPWIVGEELSISDSKAHVNVYPVKEQIKGQPLLPEAFATAKEQGAVAQWNHPGWPSTDWAWAQTAKSLEGTEFDAWEHVPAWYDEWKTAGKAPLILGSTDSHNTTIWPLERTVVLAPECNGNEVANAIKAKKAGLWNATSRDLFYGSDEMVGYVTAALADGNALRQRKAESLRKSMERADVAGLLRDSKPRRR